MLKDYLYEFLDGKKTNDYVLITNKRGRIALVDLQTLKVYGYANLIGVREKTKEEYVSWHLTAD